MIDWTRVAELHDEIGTEDFREVVALFLQEIDTALAALPRQSKANAALEAELHSLKGSALNLGFEKLSALCHQGECAARDGLAASIDLARIAETARRSRDIFLRELETRLAA